MRAKRNPVRPSRRSMRTVLRLERLEARDVPASGDWAQAVGGGLAEFWHEYQATGSAAFGSELAGNLILRGDAVKVSVRGTGDDVGLLSALGSVGFQPTATQPGVAIVEGYLPLNSLPVAVGFAETRSVMPIFPGRASSQGAFPNQAEQSMNTAVLTQQFGLTGAGITVGVISTSANLVAGGIAASQASGDLPTGNRVIVLQDLDPVAGAQFVNDEGRAMMELIYDIAPGVNFVYNSGILAGDMEFGNVITALVNAGSDIIVDDIGNLTEPFFQDGFASRAITDAAARGVTYFSSIGNTSDEGYESVFRGVEARLGRRTTRLHDFEPGPDVVTAQSIVVQPGRTDIFLQYDNPFYGGNGISSDVNVFLLDETGAVVSDLGNSNNFATGQPIEQVVFMNRSRAPRELFLSVEVASGPDVGRFRYNSFSGIEVQGFRSVPEAFVSGADAGHPSTREAVAVAASDFRSPLVPEPFTSQGPTTRVFDVNGNRLSQVEVRFKPELTANDATSTSVPGFNPFFGTSAAAPNAAAVGALLLGFRPNLTPAQLRAVLIAGTIDIGGDGYDLTTGFGLLDAVRAFEALQGPVPESPLPAPRQSYVAAGADAGGSPHVRVFDATTGNLTHSFFAYDSGFLGGVRVAVGDVNNDGVPDVITGPGATGGPHVKAFSGATGQLIQSFFAFDAGFTGGVYVAVGDYNLDGFDDFVVGAGAGGAPHVRVFDGRTLRVLHSFYAFDESFGGGVRVAAGDVNGDGQLDVIVGAGPGGGLVRVFNGKDASVIEEVPLARSAARGGVYVASGDVNADGFADLILGGPSSVDVIDGKGGGLVNSFATGRRAPEARVGAIDANRDGRIDVVIGFGPTSLSEVSIITAADGAFVITPIQAFGDDFNKGIFVAGGTA